MGSPKHQFAHQFARCSVRNLGEASQIGRPNSTMDGRCCAPPSRTEEGNDFQTDLRGRTTLAGHRLCGWTILEKNPLSRCVLRRSCLRRLLRKSWPWRLCRPPRLLSQRRPGPIIGISGMPGVAEVTRRGTIWRVGLCKGGGTNEARRSPCHRYAPEPMCLTLNLRATSKHPRRLASCQKRSRIKVVSWSVLSYETPSMAHDHVRP